MDDLSKTSNRNGALQTPIHIENRRDPVWREVCVKLGRDPDQLEEAIWEYDRESSEEQHASLMAEQAAKAEKQRQLDEALNLLLEVIAHNPARVRKALGLADDCNCLAPLERFFYER
jgi:hypothetical protein